MGEVIQLFKNPAPPPEEFNFDDHVSDDFQDVLHAVIGDIKDLWTCESAEEFTDRMRQIKAAVGQWPDG